MIRSDKLKPAVWELVSRLLKDPEKLAAGMNRLIGQGAAWRADGPDRESEILLDRSASAPASGPPTRISRRRAS